MKSKARYIGFAALVMAILAFAVVRWDAVFKIVVRIPLLGWLVAYNIPPDDFYEPLGKAPLRAGAVDITFRCKYRGRHEIRIEGINSTLLWESNIGMNIVIRGSDGNICYKNVCANSDILGGANGNYNYCYAIFNAPNDVPLGEDVVASIICYGEVKNLLLHFPDAEIVVTKTFDK